LNEINGDGDGVTVLIVAFLQHDVMLVWYMLSSCLSVCLTVRLSVTSRHCMAKCRIMQTMLYDNPGLLT